MTCDDDLAQLQSNINDAAWPRSDGRLLPLAYNGGLMNRRPHAP